MLKFIFLLLVTACLTSCVINQEPIPEHVRIANTISHQFIRDVQKNDGFMLDGFGGGMVDDIKRVFLSFNTFHIFQISEVRELIVVKEEQFLKMLNSNQEARPYLHDFPATSKNFRLAIGFIKPNRKFVDSPYVAFAKVLEGKIFYDVYNDQKKMLELVYSESYDEAYEIVYGHPKIIDASVCSP